MCNVLDVTYEGGFLRGQSEICLGGEGGGGLNSSDSESSDEEEHTDLGRRHNRFEGSMELLTGGPEVPPTSYDPNQPWYYDCRQGWHHNAGSRHFNKGWNMLESNKEKSQITIESKLNMGKIESFSGDNCSAWKT